MKGKLFGAAVALMLISINNVKANEPSPGHYVLNAVRPEAAADVKIHMSFSGADLSDVETGGSAYYDYDWQSEGGRFSSLAKLEQYVKQFCTPSFFGPRERYLVIYNWPDVAKKEWPMGSQRPLGRALPTDFNSIDVSYTDPEMADQVIHVSCK